MKYWLPLPFSVLVDYFLTNHGIIYRPLLWVAASNAVDKNGGTQGGNLSRARHGINAMFCLFQLLFLGL